jgi:hypothetical protein
MAELLLISAEVSAVRDGHLGPRSRARSPPPDLLEHAAAMAQSDPRQRVAVTFDAP